MTKKEKELTKRVEDCVNEMNVLKKEIYDRMKTKAPPELHKTYEELKTKKEEVETERNKIAIKAQKRKDKVIPMVQKLIKPFLQDEFEDCGNIEIIDGELVVTIFS